MLSLGPCQEQPVQVCAQRLAREACAVAPGPARLPRGWGPRQPPLQQPFMHDFLQIKESFALISLSGTAVCAFQDQPSHWLPLPGSSPRKVERRGLLSQAEPWGA